MRAEAGKEGSMPLKSPFIERSLARMLDRVVIPEELRRRRGSLLLHVSDTPSAFYRCLGRIILTIDPSCIIHTGDFVDEIKLERKAGDLDLYRQRVRGLLAILRGERAREIILVTGNHDAPDIVMSEAGGCTVLESGGTATVCGRRANVGHSLADLPESFCRLNFYGHDTTVPPQRNDRLYFNGVLSMNCIGLSDDKMFFLRYPSFVERERQCIRSTGL